LRDSQSTHTFENRWGIYSATYYSPSDKQDSIHPTIVFVHGFRARKEWYSWIGELLASRGYSALLFTVPSAKLPDPNQWSDGIKSAVDYLLNKEYPLYNETSPDKIGVMGHSMGGLGALMAGSEDNRIRCIVGLAPAIIPDVFQIPKKLHDISSPIQLQIGSNDGLIPAENVRAFFDSLSSKKKSYVEIRGGNHIRFVDKGIVSTVGEFLSRFGALGRRFRDGRASITFEEQHSISGNNFVDWFDSHLKH